MCSDFNNIYRGRRVLVTGHTGFKGSWMSEWLLGLGAKVYGYGLDPLPNATLFDQLNLGPRLACDYRENILDRKRLTAVIRDIAPEFVFHLAAQPLVRLSYAQPVETFAVNFMGTVHVLDALGSCNQPCTIILVTTDKCYENREWIHSYREDDPLGGHDPYSASKGAAEIAISAWRRSFSKSQKFPLWIASARAGNVIGGGDWALDRIVPDAIRAYLQGIPVALRNPHATRPWQHVLEPLSGYLQLAAAIHSMGHRVPISIQAPMDELCSPFNFGPSVSSNQTVGALIGLINQYTGGSCQRIDDPTAPHEASKLHLSTDKAFHLLGWEPRWDFQQTVHATVEWYLQAIAGADAGELTRRQIKDFTVSKQLI